MPTKLTRIAIVDDHPVLAESLAMTLGTGAFVAVAMDYKSPTLATRISDGSWDIAVLDLALGDDETGGLKLARRLAPSAVAVVILTGSSDLLIHAECLEAGAVAVLSKSGSITEVVYAINRISRGVDIVSAQDRHAALERLAEARKQHKADPLMEALTQKERVVLRMIVNGSAAARIARDLGISTFTVRTHIRSILSKLGVHTQLEAVRLALKNHWDLTDN
jgi:two-component system, NarL family, nitrate/nitrite response regulator NarL